jgi:hypothetical protein
MTNQHRRLLRKRLTASRSGSGFLVPDARVMGLLAGAGFETVADLVRIEVGDLRLLPGFGDRAVRVVAECLCRIKKTGLRVDLREGMYHIGCQEDNLDLGTRETLRSTARDLRRQLDAVESEYLRRTTDPWGHGGGRRRLVRSPYPRL